MNEEKLLDLLYKAEEYEDTLDVLHPEDEISPDLTKLKTLGVVSSKIAVVVGHTKRSPGAEGVSPISMREYFWNRRLAKHIQSISNSKNVECGIFFRDGIGITGAYKKVKEWSPNSCIELHFNAFNSRVKGTETLYGLYEESKIWANAIQNSMVELYARNNIFNRGIKLRKIGERGGKNVNKLIDIPSCLIEPYFGDHAEDAVLADDYFMNLANIIVMTHKNKFS